MKSHLPKHTPASILIVDDDNGIRKILREILEFEKFTVDEAVDGIDCLDKVKMKQYDLILLDIGMPRLSGDKVLERMQVWSPETPVIMLSAHSDLESAIELIHNGAFNYLAKPVNLDKLLVTIRKALFWKKKKPKQTAIETEPKSNNVPPQAIMVGRSEAMKKLQLSLSKVAPFDIRVLFTGENGTGKGLAAKWIHEHSNRAKKVFVTVNCSAIPEGMIESELFGHTEAAYTGAKQARAGRFLQAHGGTLFLDEVGNLDISIQRKLLNVLQDKEVYKLGEDKPTPVDVRVIAATNKNLLKEIEEGRFLLDLFYRLSAIEIEIPPLRERPEDIPLFLDHFNQLVSREQGTKPCVFTQGAIQLLQKMPWRGNVRELQNAVERFHVFCNGTVTEEDVIQYLKP